MNSSSSRSEEDTEAVSSSTTERKSLPPRFFSAAQPSNACHALCCIHVVHGERARTLPPHAQTSSTLSGQAGLAIASTRRLSPFSSSFGHFFFSLASLMPDNVVTEARIAHCPRRIREKKVREQSSSSDHAEVAPCR